MKKIIDYFSFDKDSRERKYRTLYLKDRNKLEERDSIEGNGRRFIWVIIILFLLVIAMTLVEVYF
jgi:hypothetical protein